MNTLVRLHDFQTNRALLGFLNALADAQLTHYASDLLPELELVDEIEFMRSIKKAQQVLTTLSLPLDQHFRKIYRTREGHVFCDYKLSPMAYMLVGINGNVANRKVASIQHELIKKLLG